MGQHRPDAARATPPTDQVAVESVDDHSGTFMVVRFLNTLTAQTRWCDDTEPGGWNNGREPEDYGELAALWRSQRSRSPRIVEPKET
jgi:hypothetical protein